MNSYLFENENEKEEQNDYIKAEEIEITPEMQMKSSKSKDDIKACVKVVRGLEEIDKATLLFYPIKERNALVQLFYQIRCENLVNDIIKGNNTLRFMAWVLKEMKNVNKAFTKLYEIRDILLQELGIFAINYSELDEEYICEQLIKLKELAKTIEEENCKIKISLDNEIFNRITNGESGNQILDDAYSRIVEIIPEIKEITQEDIDEYIEDEKKIYNQFFVL